MQGKTEQIENSSPLREAPNDTKFFYQCRLFVIMTRETEKFKNFEILKHGAEGDVLWNRSKRLGHEI